MKIFRSARNSFLSIGVCVDRASFGPYEFEHILVYILYIMLLSLHIVFEAKTAKEYIESASNIALIIITLLGYLCFKYNSRALFKIIDDLERAINKSE